MTHRYAALSRHLLERHPVAVGAKNFLCASLLPWREPTPDRPRHWPHASIGLSDMHPEPQQDMVEKQRVSLVGMAEGGQQQAPQAENRDVVDACAGLIAQIANSQRCSVVSDLVQRRTRQIK